MRCCRLGKQKRAQKGHRGCWTLFCLCEWYSRRKVAGVYFFIYLRAWGLFPHLFLTTGQYIYTTTTSTSTTCDANKKQIISFPLPSFTFSAIKKVFAWIMNELSRDFGVINKKNMHWPVYLNRVVIKFLSVETLKSYGRYISEYWNFDFNNNKIYRNIGLT